MACNQYVWGGFMLVLAIGWLLNLTGILDASIWRFAGPLALIAVAIGFFTTRGGGCPDSDGPSTRN